MNDTLIIPIILTVIAGLGAAAIVYARWHWAIRWTLITFLLGSGLVLWPIVDDLRGWPAVTELPEVYKLHWVIVDEPTTTHAGGIYLLVEDMKIAQRGMLDHKIDPKSPRLYKIQYSRAGHKQAQEILQGMMSGKGSSTMQRNGRPGKGKPGGVDGPEISDGMGKDGGGGSNEEDPLGYELPPAKPPTKD